MEEIKVCGLGRVSRFPNDVSYALRGRDSSYFGFIPTFGLILGWFYAMLMACFVALIGRILWLVERAVPGWFWVKMACTGAAKELSGTQLRSLVPL